LIHQTNYSCTCISETGGLGLPNEPAEVVATPAPAPAEVVATPATAPAEVAPTPSTAPAEVAATPAPAAAEVAPTPATLEPAKKKRKVREAAAGPR
jgi:hypothetical protein